MNKYSIYTTELISRAIFCYLQVKTFSMNTYLTKSSDIIETD